MVSKNKDANNEKITLNEETIGNSVINVINNYHNHDYKDLKTNKIDTNLNKVLTNNNLENIFHINKTLVEESLINDLDKYLNDQLLKYNRSNFSKVGFPILIDYFKDSFVHVKLLIDKYFKTKEKDNTLDKKELESKKNIAFLYYMLIFIDSFPLLESKMFEYYLQQIKRSDFDYPLM